MQLTLLARAYCHLCDEMLEAVKPLADARRVTVAVVDVDTDSALEAEYGDRVPILFVGEPVDGIELCHYRLDRVRVEAALAGVPVHHDRIAPEAKIR